MKISMAAGKRARVAKILSGKEALAVIIPIILSMRCGVYGIHPFGLALFASLMPSWSGLIAVLIGSVTLGLYGIKYILAAALFLYIIYIKEFDRILSSIVLSLCLVFIGIFEGLFFGNTVSEYLIMLSEGVLTGVIYCIFLPLKKSDDSFIFKRSSSKNIALVMLISAVLNGLSGIPFMFGAELNILVAVLFVLVLSKSVSFSESVSWSIIISAISGLGNDGYITIISCFALSALFSSMLRTLEKWGIALGFLSGLSLIMLLEGTRLEMRGFYVSIILASVLFLFIPEFLADIISAKIREFSSESCIGYESTALKRRIQRVTKEHNEISKSLKNIEFQLKTDAEEPKKEPIYSAYSSLSQRSSENGISGDLYTEFFTEKDRFYAILCDGMGSGRKALRESKMTAELLKEFIKSGFLKEKAVSMINSALALKGDDESFSTVDLLELDMVTGDAEFLKIGSAESFVKHKDYVETLSSASLPVGIIEDVKSETIKRRLSYGDIIVMVSDGVGEAGYGILKGEWIKRLIKTTGGDIDALSEEILTEAIKRSKPDKEDDMTVVVIKIIRNNKRAENE